MTIHEPATLVTDLLLTALAGGLAWRLRRRGPVTAAASWWCWALAFTATSALIGGFYHGLAPNFPAVFHGPWWTLTLLTICLTAAAMDLALVHEVARPEHHRRWITVVGFKFAGFASAVVTAPKFLVVIVDYGLTMLLWAIFASVLRRAWTGAMLAGIALSLIAATVQQLRIGVTTHFNHNDLYHLVQAFALIAFYRAGLGFRGSPPLAGHG